MESNNKEIKYSSYTEAQKKATKKYRENNKEKINEQRKKYYQHRKNTDPDFLPYKRQKAKEYYDRKKALKAQWNNTPEYKEVEEVIVHPELKREENIKPAETIYPSFVEEIEKEVQKVNPELQEVKELEKDIIETIEKIEEDLNISNKKKKRVYKKNKKE